MWRYLFFFGIALLSGLGVGSAGIPVLYLTMIEGLPQLTAQGINLFFFLLASAAALAVHVRNTPLLYKCLFLMIPLGLLGSYLGTMLAERVPQALLRTLFGAFLIVSGTLGLLRSRK